MFVTEKNPRDVPICTFIGLSLVLVFILFNAQVINAIPCGNNIHEVFMSNFVHIDLTHLMYNLYALYALSRVEKEMGFRSFIWLFIFLLFFNTLAEYGAKKIWVDLKCSIGFSGVLFGMMTWELLTKNKFDMTLFVAIVIMVIFPSLNNKKISLRGHAIGAISGIIGGILWKILNDKRGKL